jgi:proteic killer suppression protein
MIKSIADTATRQFVETGKSRFSGLDPAKAMARLNVLNAARSLDDISPLRSIGLHKLTGDRKGQWAMTINGPWRLCFRFENGDAYNVEIIDYH